MQLAVLMSTYNGERFLRQQIDSILGQICDCQVDLWVRDDGSQDRTCEILEEYAASGKLRWYTGPNLKPAKSFLDLIQHCPGYDYYAFADQDDYWYSDKLQNGIDHLKGMDGPGLSYANARLVDAQLQPLGRNVFRRTPHLDFYSVTCGAGILGCTVLFNKALAQLIQEKPMPEELIMHDVYMGVVCTLHDGKIVYDEAPQLDYRQHGSNVVGSTWSKVAALKDRIHRATVRPENTLDKMADSICKNYPQVPDEKKLRWLKSVSQYRQSVFRALRLALDTKPTYNSWNMAITLRLAIFLRNL